MLKSFETERAYLNGVNKGQKRFTVKFSALVNERLMTSLKKRAKALFWSSEKHMIPNFLLVE